MMVLLARRARRIARHPVGTGRADYENAAGEIECLAEPVPLFAVVGEQLLAFGALRFAARENVRRTLLIVVAGRSRSNGRAVHGNVLAETIGCIRIRRREPRDAL